MTNATTLEYDRQSEAPKPMWLGLPISAWLGIGVVTLLMVATFRFNLIRLWGKTNPISGESEWQHAFVVPLIGLYYLFVNRDELLKAKIKPLLVKDFGKGRWGGAAGLVIAGLMLMFIGPSVISNQADVLRTAGKGLIALAALVMAIDWGLAMMVFGLLFFGYGIWPGQNDYFKDLGMVCTLFGVVLTLCGWDVMKVTWFPIAFLICALPWPGLFYSWVAGPLQVLAAKVAVIVLQIGNVPNVYQSGTKINLPTRPLNVAEACAGLKSLMTFVTVSASVAFLSSRPLWQRLVMVAAAVPIAIFCNVMRVSGQGLLDWYAGQEWSENFAHQFVGMVMLIPAFFLILGFGWLLDQLFVEEADEETDRAVAVASGVTKDLVKDAPVAAMSAIPAAPMAPLPIRAVKARASAVIDRQKEAFGDNGARTAVADAPTPQTSAGVTTASASPASEAAGSSPANTALPPVTSLPPARAGASSRGGGRRGFVPPGFVPPPATSSPASTPNQATSSETPKEQK